MFKGGEPSYLSMERSPCVIRNPRKDRLRLPPRSHEDPYVLVKSRTTETDLYLVLSNNDQGYKNIHQQSGISQCTAKRYMFVHNNYPIAQNRLILKESVHSRLAQCQNSFEQITTSNKTSNDPPCFTKT